MKSNIFNNLLNRIDLFLNKYESGSICLGSLTDKELNKIQTKYSNYKIEKDYFGYWNFKKQN